MSANSIRKMLVCAFALCAWINGGAQTRPDAASNFPSKPIRIILPVTTGGATDIGARHVGQQLQKLWGQPVVIEAMAGAGGVIAARTVARAEPDGYTLLMAVNSFSISPVLMKNIGYSPLGDFTPVGWLFESPLVLLSTPSLQVRNVAELVALVKASPGKLNVGIAGNGTAVHLATAAFRRSAGLDVLEVPYRGQAPAITDLLSGKIDVMFAEPSTMKYAIDGKVRALAVTSRIRMTQYPEVPTVMESGFPNYTAGAWFGLIAPARTPEAVVVKLNAAINESLKAQPIKEFMDTLGFQAVGGSPKNLWDHVRSELELNAKLVAETGIRAE